MPDDLDFSAKFAACQSIAQVNSLYKELYPIVPDWEPLAEAQRRALEGLSVERRAVEKVEPDPDRIPPRVVRNWAMRKGISMPRRGRIPKDILEQYREENRDVPSD